ncbi:hypothetical protein D3C87_1644400 [compost metagenome]
MKNTDDTRVQPGAVLISCRAGRMVLAVVLITPDTRPSTSSRASIMVPITTVSSSCCSAIGAFRLLVLRSATIGSTYRSRIRSGSRISSPGGSSMPWARATASTSAGLASNTQRAMPRAWQIAAACTVNGSLPSGRTMRLLAAWARWIS